MPGPARLASIGYRGQSYCQEIVGVDREVCTCGERMIVDHAITDGEKIAEVLVRLGRRFARFNGLTYETAINGGATFSSHPAGWSQ